MNRTPITYYGGKQQMVKHILPEIPPHRIYCEPYFGGGALFFAKKPSYLEVINDTNQKLICFYETMRSDFENLNELIENTLHSEAMYNYAKEIYNEKRSATYIEMAWSVWMVTNMSYSGSTKGGWKWCNGTAGSHTGRYISRKSDEFKKLRDRLKNVQIECTDAISIIISRDTENTFFYLDPPYPGHCQQHYRGYSMKDFTTLLEVISDLKGKFILSNFSNQSLTYHLKKNNWIISKFKMPNKVTNFTNPRSKTEILIKNFKTNINLFNQ